MADGPPEHAVTAPFGAVEPNLILAGMEAAAFGWLAYAALAGVSVMPPPPPERWMWYYLIFAVVALLALILLGLLVEGLAGLVEYAITRKRGGKGELLPWYKNAVRQPPDWSLAQRWMWTSPQASAEFARRRTRLLLSRNTALLVLLLTVALAVAVCRAAPAWWFGKMLLVLFGGSALTGLFVFLWLSAHRGWNQAVEDASKLGCP